MLTCADIIAEKALRGVVAVTAGRGRVRVIFANAVQPLRPTPLLWVCSRSGVRVQGKSAALGLSIAAAIGFGYSNIFVTAPSPENLKTLFEFVFKGFDALAYVDHVDYEAVASTNPSFGKAVVRVNVFREHRQTIQFIQPEDAEKLSQAELVVIDEAAAIPLPIVQRLLGPHLVFMASTINGYEGTGRSLSLKLVTQLRRQSAAVAPATPAGRSAAIGPSKALSAAPSAADPWQGACCVWDEFAL